MIRKQSKQKKTLKHYLKKTKYNSRKELILEGTGCLLKPSRRLPRFRSRFPLPALHAGEARVLPAAVQAEPPGPSDSGAPAGA